MGCGASKVPSEAPSGPVKVFAPLPSKDSHAASQSGSPSAQGNDATGLPPHLSPKPGSRTPSEELRPSPSPTRLSKLTLPPLAALPRVALPPLQALQLPHDPPSLQAQGGMIALPGVPLPSPSSISPAPEKQYGFSLQVGVQLVENRPSPGARQMRIGLRNTGSGVLATGEGAGVGSPSGAASPVGDRWLGTPSCQMGASCPSSLLGQEASGVGIGDQAHPPSPFAKKNVSPAPSLKPESTPLDLLPKAAAHRPSGSSNSLYAVKLAGGTKLPGTGIRNSKPTSTSTSLIDALAFVRSGFTDAPPELDTGHTTPAAGTPTLHGANSSSIEHGVLKAAAHRLDHILPFNTSERSSTSPSNTPPLTPECASKIGTGGHEGGRAGVRFASNMPQEHAPVVVPLAPSFGFMVEGSTALRELDADLSVGTALGIPLTSQSRASSRASECSDDGEGSLASTSPHSAAQSIRAASWATSTTGFRVASATGAELVARAVKRNCNCEGAAEGMTAIMQTGPRKQLSRLRQTERSVSACAVSLAFLLEFSSTLAPGMTTLEVVYKLVVPETAAFRCRYADFIPPAHCSTPTYFVSHRWASPFQALVSSLSIHFDVARSLGRGTLDPSKVFLWLDIFAVNQHPGEAQAGDLAGLQAALAAAQNGTLLCLDEQGHVLTRIWCLYEIHHTIRLKGTSGLRVLAADVQFAELRDIFNSLDASRAQATVEEDRKRILTDIQATTGIEALNHGIKEALIESCMLEAASTVRHRKLEPRAFASAHYKAGQLLRVAGRYQDAESALRKDGLEKEDKQMAAGLVTLGTLMQEQGKLPVAEVLCRQGLELCERLLTSTVARYRVGGEEQPGADVTITDVVYAYNNLASVLQAQGKFAEALPYFEKALATCKKVHGESQKDTVTAMQSLAQLFQAMGRSADALKLLRRAKALREKAVSYDALGIALQGRGAYEDAEPLFLQALEVRRLVLGAGHPAVAASLHNLAALMQDMGRVEEAEAFYGGALELRERVLGPGHPATASSLNNLAALYKEAGQVEMAVPLLQRALDARQTALGPEHPATSSSLNNLATLLLERGLLNEAAPLFKEHVRVLEKVLGPAHSEVAMALQNYAMCLKAGGDLGQAEALFRRAMHILEEANGANHPDLAVCAASLARLLQEAGQLEGATAMFERALDITRTVFGEHHRSVVTQLHALGVIAAKQGFLYQAETRLRSAITLRRALTEAKGGAYSPTSSTLHPVTSKAMEQLGKLQTMRRDGDYVGSGGQKTGLELRTSYENAASGKSVLNAGGLLGGAHMDAPIQLASSLNELGSVLADQERAQEAEKAYEEALDLRKHMLGPSHHDTAITLENLGCLLLDMGKAPAAEPFLRQALAANTIALLRSTTPRTVVGGNGSGSITGPNTAAAALSHYNLGRALEAQGGAKSAEAEHEYTEAVAVAQVALGYGHVDTEQYCTNLGEFLAASAAGNKASSRAEKKKKKKKIVDSDRDVEIEY